LRHHVFKLTGKKVFTLINLTPFSDEKTHAHSEKVGEITRIMVTAAGYDKEEAEFLKEAAALHDVGKQFIPPNILLKPGALTNSEFEVVKTHAFIGYRFILNNAIESLELAKKSCGQTDELNKLLWCASVPLRLKFRV
jgi:HD-GYP domain-containing protein (c-di-GMP phosphodiesterase class II)